MSIENEILRTLAREWLIERPTVFERNQTYPTRIVFGIETEGGRLAVKLDTEATTSAQIDVCQYLQTNRYRHCPEPVLSRNGRSVETCAVGTLGVFEYIPEPLGGSPVADTVWSAIGHAAAKLNSLTDFGQPYRVDARGALGELRAWGAHQDFSHNVIALVDEIDDTLDLGASAGLIHAELNPTNVRQRPDGDVVILDWDEAGHGPLALELGYPLICVFLDPATLEFNRSSAQAFYSGYSRWEGSKLVAAESIWQAALVHALRSATFFDSQTRWNRVVQAVRSKEDLVSVLW